MNGYYLGLDLGTSSVKALLANRDGVLCKEKEAYASATAKGWEDAVRRVIARLSSCVGANAVLGIGLSSQVGTYLVDDGNILHWWEAYGRDELERIKNDVLQEEFLRDISMYHPDIISYPLPRLAYIKRNYPNVKRVRMPKELLTEMLTGRCVSDPYSWRGVYNFERKDYARGLLERLKLDMELPALVSPTDVAGYVNEQAAKTLGLNVGTPVYTGMNDFFSGLLGMGVIHAGDCFEISGTSEHVGFIGEEICKDAPVSGHYLRHYVTYGGTKSSGASCDLALRELDARGLDVGFAPSVHTPIFLPYLRGERAPIYDENARGVFFGMDADTTRADLAYAVLEGVTFSLYDVASRMDMPKGGKLITGGGSAKDALMARIKAELFQKEILACKEGDTSALGAALTAMIGAGAYADYEEAASGVEYEACALPMGKDRQHLLWRFERYRSLYPTLKNEFKKWNE